MSQDGASFVIQHGQERLPCAGCFLEKYVRRNPGLLLLVLALSALAPARASVYISGRIVAEGGHTAVPDVVVSLYEDGASDPIQVTRSFLNGSFVLQAPAAGAYRLEVDGKDIDSVQKAIDVPRAGLPSVEIPVPVMAVLRVMFLSPDGKPTTGDVVRAWLVVTVQKNGKNGHSRLTSGTSSTQVVPANGVLEFNPPHSSFAPTDATQIVIGARDEAGGCVMDSRGKWPQGVVTIHLKPGCTLVGKVVDKDGKPAAHVPILAGPDVDGSATTNPGEAQTERDSPCFYQGEVSTISGEDGSFTIPSLFAGCRFMVQATFPDAGTRFRKVALTGSKTEITVNPSDPLWNGGAPAVRIPNDLPPPVPLR